MSKRIYFVAGEASGDTHGAALMTALRESDRDLVLLGRGGPRMKEIAGEQFTDWSDRSAVLGLWEVLKQYGYFRRQFAATLREIREQKPDAVLLIDYPGFNLRLARALRAQLPKTKDHLLHQPAGLGVEPAPHPADGALSRPDALHLSIRGGAL